MAYLGLILPTDCSFTSTYQETEVNCNIVIIGMISTRSLNHGSFFLDRNYGCRILTLLIENVSHKTVEMFCLAGIEPTLSLSLEHLTLIRAISGLGPVLVLINFIFKIVH